MGISKLLEALEMAINFSKWFEKEEFRILDASILDLMAK
jgi:hypothetical protein